MAKDSKFSKCCIFYKSKADGSGSASQWNLSSTKDSVFLEMVNQKGKDSKGNASFDWDNKVGFKLGSNDIGEILAVLIGMQKGVGPFDSNTQKHKGLYHSNPSGNSLLFFGKDDIGRFRIYLSAKRNDNKTIIQHMLTKGDACILSTLLRRAIEVMYMWD